jgi:protein subunit release factor A
MDLRPFVEKFARRLAEVEAELSDPKVFAQNARFQELSREYARLKSLVQAGHASSRPALISRRIAPC